MIRREREREIESLIMKMREGDRARNKYQHAMMFAYLFLILFSIFLAASVDSQSPGGNICKLCNR